jgi:hypothetical protein
MLPRPGVSLMLTLEKLFASSQQLTLDFEKAIHNVVKRLDSPYSEGYTF